MFRKRADRIKGVAGSLDGRAVLIADAVAGAGPGLMGVAAAAGASVMAAATDTAMLDVTIADIAAPPYPIKAMPPPASLSRALPDRIDDVVINPWPQDTMDAIQPWLDLARDLGAGMRDRGHTGSIVLVTGIERAGATGSIAAFIRSEMEDLASEYAANSIRVNAVACGPIGATRRGQPRSSRATPLGHMTIHPIDVGKAVWFLLNGDLSAAVTGATLRVDRGAALTRPDW